MNEGSIAYRFEDRHGRSSELVIDQRERRRLRDGAARGGAFVLRETGSGYVFITPYAGYEVDGTITEEFAVVDLADGGRAQVSLETFGKFVSDVTEGQAGSYQAERVDPR